jgi:hypothetical protein
VGRVQRRYEFLKVQRETGVTYVPQPFTDTPLSAVAPDGSGMVLVARSAAGSQRGATFTVRKLDPSGRVLFARSYPYAPHELGEEMVDAAVGRHVEGLEAARMTRLPPASLGRMIRSALYRPRYLTPVTDVVVGRDGTIWLRREESGDVVGWNVLDAGGRMIGTLTLPVRLNVQYADRTQLWALELDELDVPTLARFRVLAR